MPRLQSLRLRLALGGLLLTMLSLTSCNYGVIDLDVQGHRGCRGLMPENSIAAFEKAWELGVNTLEMDVVVTRDAQVVVSHEAWMSHEFCSKPDGSPVTEAEEKSLNIFQMDYADVKSYDCGKRGHPRFPNQHKMATTKPLLRDVIAHMEQVSDGQVDYDNYREPRYNIELKTEPGSAFNPDPKRFVELVMAVLDELDTEPNVGLKGRVTLQSFDLAILHEVRRQARDMRIALLVEEDEDYRTRLSELGDYPDILSPAFQHVDAEMLAFANTKNMTVVPWTVNEEEDMRRLVKLGVHGIITDYPDRLLNLLQEL